jgi:hypothetical protein
LLVAVAAGLEHQQVLAVAAALVDTFLDLQR